jgi:ketosteroid isomerase-like protein
VAHVRVSVASTLRPPGSAASVRNVGREHAYIGVASPTSPRRAGRATTASEDAMAPQSFDEAVETARRNLGSMAKGNAAPSVALLSQRDDVVLNNPLGPPIVGFANVAAEVERVASMFVDGDPPVFDEVTRWVSDDLGYVVAIEHSRVKRSGSEGFVPMDLRVTMIFRRESDGWRVCVRHADRVTGPPTPTG